MTRATAASGSGVVRECCLGFKRQEDYRVHWGSVCKWILPSARACTVLDEKRPDIVSSARLQGIPHPRVSAVLDEDRNHVDLIVHHCPTQCVFVVSMHVGASLDEKRRHICLAIIARMKQRSTFIVGMVGLHVRTGVKKHFHRLDRSGPNCFIKCQV